MTIDERLEAITMNLELAIRESEAQRLRISEFDLRMDELGARMNELGLTMNEVGVTIHRLGGSVNELGGRIGQVLNLVEINSQNIHALVGIAQAHERRIDTLET